MAEVTIDGQLFWERLNKLHKAWTVRGSSFAHQLLDFFSCAPASAPPLHSARLPPLSLPLKRPVVMAQMMMQGLVLTLSLTLILIHSTPP